MHIFVAFSDFIIFPPISQAVSYYFRLSIEGRMVSFVLALLLGDYPHSKETCFFCLFEIASLWRNEPFLGILFLHNSPLQIYFDYAFVNARCLREVLFLLPFCCCCCCYCLHLLMLTASRSLGVMRKGGGYCLRSELCLTQINKQNYEWQLFSHTHNVIDFRNFMTFQGRCICSVYFMLWMGVFIFENIANWFRWCI